MITIVTPTCDRPLPFALAEKYMARQTMKDFQWIVLDDGKTPVVTTMGQTVIRTNDTYGFSSLPKKLMNLFVDPNRYIKTDSVAIIEDDDWYAPNYLEYMVGKLSQGDIVGEGRTIYYNVALRRWAVHTNMTHCSLCATGFNRRTFQAFYNEAACLDPFVDMRFWERASQRFTRLIYDPDRQLCGRTFVGIKGMPGKRGYSTSHNPDDPNHRNAFQDLDLTKLRSWIGDDADAYAPFYVQP